MRRMEEGTSRQKAPERDEAEEGEEGSNTRENKELLELRRPNLLTERRGRGGRVHRVMRSDDENR